MTGSEFDFIAKSSNIDKKSCSRAFNGTIITYFKFDHDCGYSLEGRYIEKPDVYDIMAVEGEFISVKIVKPTEAMEYIKQVFYMWEEYCAKKSTVS